MDNHSKNVCLVSILHITGYIIEIFGLFSAHYKHMHDKNEFLSVIVYLLPTMGFYLFLAASVALTIYGVLERRHLYFIPFFGVCALELIRPIKFFDFPTSFYIIAIEIMTLYPTITLFLDLRDKSLKTV